MAGPRASRHRLAPSAAGDATERHPVGGSLCLAGCVLTMATLMCGRQESRESCQLVPREVTFIVTRIRRGGYVFITRVSDHRPRHVHVLANGRLVAKWDLEHGRPLAGLPSQRLVKLIEELQREGKL
jgi:hypothetical protein